MPLLADRVPIVWAFSTSRLRHVWESVAPLLADVAQVRVFDKGFEEALRVARELVEAGEEVDAFVAAGSNGAYIRDHADVPVVVVAASTVDALQAVIQARKGAQAGPSPCCDRPSSSRSASPSITSGVP